MKNVVLAAVVVIAACGGGDPPKLLDSGVAPAACDPIAQTGCKADQKCTWIIDVDADPVAKTEQVGHTGCAPAGTIALGGTCAEATVLVNGGADACVAGDLCIVGQCKAICDPQLASGTAAGACDVDHSCAPYSAVFISGDNAVAGVCEPACNPLTQRLDVGGAEQCGSSNVTQPDFACTPSQSFRSFLCAPSDPTVWPLTERETAQTDSAGRVFSNGCSPGYIPLLSKDNDAGTNTVICSGLCAPRKVDSQLAGSGNPDRINQGDKSALGKLLNDTAPVAGHATCAPDSKGSATDDEDCIYLWNVLLEFSNAAPSEALRTPYSDSLGICFAFGRYLVDVDDGPTTTKVPFPSCATLPPPELVTAADKFGSAADEGCYSLTETLAHPDAATTRKAAHHARRLRPSYGAAPLARHIFD